MARQSGHFRALAENILSVRKAVGSPQLARESCRGAWALYRLARRHGVAFEDPTQGVRFESLASRFQEVYDDVRRADPLADRFVRADWKLELRYYEKAYLPRPRSDKFPPQMVGFGRLPPTVVGDILAALKSGQSAKTLRKTLSGDCFGRASWFPPYWSRWDNVLNLYYLSRIVSGPLEKDMGPGCVVEWGGGYGNLAKLARILWPQHTYVIIDLPFSSCLQWLFLSTMLGEEIVHLWRARGDRVQAGKINLVPLLTGFLEKPLPRADWFVSTFALTESSLAAQAHVIGKDWFGARRLFLACGPQEAESPAIRAALSDGARLERPFHPLPYGLVQR